MPACASYPVLRYQGVNKTYMVSSIFTVRISSPSKLLARQLLVLTLMSIGLTNLSHGRPYCQYPLALHISVYIYMAQLIIKVSPHSLGLVK